MSGSGKNHLVIGILVGIILSMSFIFIAVKGSPPAMAQMTAGNSKLFAVTCQRQGDDDYIFLIDTDTKRLAAYELIPGKGIKLSAVREFTYDLKLTDWVNNKGFGPPVKEIQNAVKDQ